MTVSILTPKAATYGAKPTRDNALWAFLHDIVFSSNISFQQRSKKGTKGTNLFVKNPESVTLPGLQSIAERFITYVKDPNLAQTTTQHTDHVVLTSLYFLNIISNNKNLTPQQLQLFQRTIAAAIENVATNLKERHYDIILNPKYVTDEAVQAVISICTNKLVNLNKQLPNLPVGSGVEKSKTKEKENITKLLTDFAKQLSVAAVSAVVVVPASSSKVKRNKSPVDLFDPETEAVVKTALTAVDQLGVGKSEKTAKKRSAKVSRSSSPVEISSSSAVAAPVVGEVMVSSSSSSSEIKLDSDAVLSANKWPKTVAALQKAMNTVLGIETQDIIRVDQKQELNPALQEVSKQTDEIAAVAVNTIAQIAAIEQKLTGIDAFYIEQLPESVDFIQNNIRLTGKNVTIEAYQKAIAELSDLPSFLTDRGIEAKITEREALQDELLDVEKLIVSKQEHIKLLKEVCAPYLALSGNEELNLLVGKVAKTNLALNGALLTIKSDKDKINALIDISNALLDTDNSIAINKADLTTELESLISVSAQLKNASLIDINTQGIIELQPIDLQSKESYQKIKIALDAAIDAQLAKPLNSQRLNEELKNRKQAGTEDYNALVSAKDQFQQTRSQLIKILTDTFRSNSSLKEELKISINEYNSLLSSIQAVPETVTRSLIKKYTAAKVTTQVLLDEIKQNQDFYNTEYPKIAADLAVVKNLEQSLQDSVDSINAKAEKNSIFESCEELRQEIVSLNNSNKTHFLRDNELHKWQDVSANLSSDLTIIDSFQNQYESKKETLSTLAAPLSAREEALSQQLAGINAVLDSIPNTYSDAGDALKGLKNNYISSRITLNGIEDKLAEKSARLNKINGEFIDNKEIILQQLQAGYTINIVNHPDALHNLDNEIEAAKHDSNKLQELHSKLTNQLDVLQSAYSLTANAISYKETDPTYKIGSIRDVNITLASIVDEHLNVSSLESEVNDEAQQQAEAALLAQVPDIIASTKAAVTQRFVDQKAALLAKIEASSTNLAAQRETHPLSNMTKTLVPAEELKDFAKLYFKLRERVIASDALSDAEKQSAYKKLDTLRNSLAVREQGSNFNVEQQLNSKASALSDLQTGYQTALNGFQTKLNEIEPDNIVQAHTELLALENKYNEKLADFDKTSTLITDSMNEVAKTARKQFIATRDNLKSYTNDVIAQEASNASGFLDQLKLGLNLVMRNAGKCFLPVVGAAIVAAGLVLTLAAPAAGLLIAGAVVGAIGGFGAGLIADGVVPTVKTAVQIVTESKKTKETLKEFRDNLKDLSDDNLIRLKVDHASGQPVAAEPLLQADKRSKVNSVRQANHPSTLFGNSSSSSSSSAAPEPAPANDVQGPKRK